MPNAGRFREAAAISLQNPSVTLRHDGLPAARANAVDEQPYRANDQGNEHDVMGAQSVAHGSSCGDDCRVAQLV